MKTKVIVDRAEYNEVMKQIEVLLQKSTSNGGVDGLSADDTKTLQELSIMAEHYEDSIPLMPIKTPATLKEMIRFKMFEMNLKQKQLANMLETSDTRISELMNGKARLNLKLAKKLHDKLHIDANFLLEIA
jgi:HTH-type transcriptional regulator / antitoxin HigA